MSTQKVNLDLTRLRSLMKYEEKTNLIETLKRLKTLADLGLLYHTNEYDRERYDEIQKISLNLLQTISKRSLADLKVSLPTPAEYPTAKVDIRGLLLNDNNEILLVKERDGRWSLPGGWADVGFSPREVVQKEFKEETGIIIDVIALLAVFDKRKHNHPAQPFYIYKMVFLCKGKTTKFSKGFDILDVAFFDIRMLPPLSEDRILKTQIELLLERIKNKDIATYFD